MAALDKEFEVPFVPEPIEWRGDGDYFYPVSRADAHEIAPASLAWTACADRHRLEEVFKMLDGLKAELAADAGDAARWARRLESLAVEIRRRYLSRDELPAMGEPTIAICPPPALTGHVAVA